MLPAASPAPKRVPTTDPVAVRPMPTNSPALSLWIRAANAGPSTRERRVVAAIPVRTLSPITVVMTTSPSNPGLAELLGFRLYDTAVILAYATRLAGEYSLCNNRSKRLESTAMVI